MAGVVFVERKLPGLKVELTVSEVGIAALAEGVNEGDTDDVGRCDETS